MTVAVWIPVNAAVNGLWFHKDLCEQAGVTMPAGAWTWNDAIPDPAEAHACGPPTARITLWPGVRLDNNYLPVHLPVGRSGCTRRRHAPALDMPECDRGRAVHAAIEFKISRPRSRPESPHCRAGGYGGGTVITHFAGHSAALRAGRAMVATVRLAKMIQRRCVSASPKRAYGTVSHFLRLRKANADQQNSPRGSSTEVSRRYSAQRDYNR
jgi:hypothetical protein